MLKNLCAILILLLTTNTYANTSKIWEGNWSSSYGVLKLKQNGSSVTGKYRDIGIIDATASKANGKHILKGMFTNKNKRGKFKFTLIHDYKFEGKWKWDKESSLSKKWKGSKPISWSGRWKTNFGSLDLKQYNNIVTGSYKGVGIIDATASNDTLKGRFTNKNKNGIFELKFNRNNTFEGKWKWKGNNKWASQGWIGKRR